MASPRRRPSCLHLFGAHQHHVIAVEHSTGGVHENGTIAVAIEGDAKAMPPASHDIRKTFRMSRADPFVDVAAVGLAANDGDLEAKLAE